MAGIMPNRHVWTILSCPENTRKLSHTGPGGTRCRIDRKNCWQEQQPRLEAVSAAPRRNRSTLAVRWSAPTAPESDHNFDNGIRITAWITFPESFVDNRAIFQRKACEQDPPMLWHRETVTATGLPSVDRPVKNLAQNDRLANPFWIRQ
jgi:hypothetical protein